MPPTPHRSVQWKRSVSDSPEVSPMEVAVSDSPEVSPVDVVLSTEVSPVDDVVSNSQQVSPAVSQVTIGEEVCIL